MAYVFLVSLLLTFSFPHPSSSPRSHGVEVSGKEANQGSILRLSNLSRSTGISPLHVFQLTWHPRVFLYKGFLSDEECDHLISLAEGKLQKASEIDKYSGRNPENSVFTGSGMFLDRGQDEIVARIEDRIAAWTFLPKENGEPMQILHYGVKEQFNPHYDFYQDKSKSVFSGHRIATVVMYLSNVTRGGETYFPRSEIKDTQSKGSTWSNCAMNKFGLKPTKGDALLFFNLHPNVTTDERSLHGSCLVVEGEKWSATKWIRVRAFEGGKDRSSLSLDGGECTDEDDSCPQWAAMGECEKNPVFMLGSPDYYGTCRKSCNVC